MRKRTTSRAKETIKEATTKATEAVKETVEKTTVKASEVIEEAKDAAADIAKAPVVEEAKETVKKAVKEVAKNIDIKKFAETTIELPGFAVTMSSIEEAIKKDIKDKGIEGKEISVYVNVEQKAAYYTVDGQGSDDYRRISFRLSGQRNNSPILFISHVKATHRVAFCGCNNSGEPRSLYKTY